MKHTFLILIIWWSLLLAALLPSIQGETDGNCFHPNNREGCEKPVEVVQHVRRTWTENGASPTDYSQVDVVIKNNSNKPIKS
jgi:hypothetical protein